MATEPTKRIQVDVPESWVPEIDQRATKELRSRHNMVLALIRAGLDGDPQWESKKLRQ